MKKLRTRKQKALGRLPVLVLCLLLFLWVYPLTPRRAIRSAEALYNCGRTTVIRELGDSGLPDSGPNRLYLSANDHVLLWTTTSFTLSSGWRRETNTVLDLTVDQPFSAAVCHLSSGDWQEAGGVAVQENWKSYLFGVVNDPAAASIRAQVVYENGQGGKEPVETEIPRDRWFYTQGRTFFAEPLPPCGAEGTWYPREVSVWLLDEAGQELAYRTAIRRTNGILS